MKPNPKNHLARLILSTIAAPAVMLFTASQVHAAILYYDGGTVDIGTNGNAAASATTGNWNTTLLNWDAGASAHVVWNNTDTAFFNAGTAFAAPTPGTVTLTEAITVGGIIFNNSGYTIASNTLTFGGTDNSISINNHNAAASATISSAIGTSAANMVFTAQNPVSANTLTFGAAGGWTGTTTVNPGLTLQLNSAATALLNTSAITLNGGTINQNYTAVADRINDAAAITSNGGTLSTNNPNSAIVATETIGAVTVQRGLTNLLHSASLASLTSQTLTLTSLTRSGATNTSAVNFASSGGLNITKNIIVVTGAAATPAGQIVGPWATTGNTGGANDYATYNGSAQVVPANIAATAESAWTASTDAFTANAGLGAITLTGTRNITALRGTSTVNPVTVTNATDTINLAAHTFVDGDAVVFGGTTPPAGLTGGTVYFVRDAAAGTFKVAATQGGAAIDFTTDGTSVNVVGAVLLSSGNNLGTLGILNGSQNTMHITAVGTGALTLPSISADQLHVNAGNTTTGGAINLSAPVTNNTGVLTLVKSGLGTLNLTGTNTFTGGITVNSGTVVVNNAGNTFATGATGADVINGGALTYSTVASMGGTGRDLTFNGTGTFTLSAGSYTGGTLTSNAGANAVINEAASGATISFATTTGSGNIIYTIGSTGSRALNLGNASAFNGNLQGRLTNNANQGTNNVITFSSIGDTAGSAIQFVGGTSDGTQPFTITLNGTSPLTFNNRQIQMLERVAGNHAISLNTLANNSALAVNTWVINTDLLYTGGRANTFGAQGLRTFQLSGTNTGNNAFNGVIGDGQNQIAVTKIGAGKWILGGNNTYTGAASVSAGTLNIQHANALGSTTGGTTVANAAKLELQGGITTAAEALTLTPGGGGNAMLHNISGNNTWSGSITANTATSSQVSRIQSDLNKLTMSGAVSLTGSAHQLVFQGDGDMEISGQITGVGRITSSNTGTGVRTLSNDTNSYTGSTSVNGGTLAFTSIGNVGAASSSLGAPVLADATIQMGSGATATLRYVGTAIGGHSSDRVINLAGTTIGTTIEANGTDALVLTATNTATGAGSKTLTLSGTNTDDNSIGAIANNSVSNTTALTKSGAGTWVLTGTNTYTGGTSVSAGILTINGSLADATMSIPSGTVNGTGTLTYNVNGLVADQVVASGGTINVSGLSVAVNPTGSGLTESEYVLVNATGGTLTGTFVGLSGAPGYTLDYGTANQVKLVQTGGSAYDTWKAANAPGSDPDDDTDGDGVTNAVEFVLGGTSASDDLDKLPEVATSGGNMTFTFERDQDSIDPGTALSIEVSTDLVTWNTAPSPYAVPDADTGVVNPGVEVDANNPAAGTDTVILTVPQAPDAKKFARLKVVITP